MPLFLSQRNIGSITILELGEQLKAQNVSEFRETLQQQLDQGRTQLLLDCSHIHSVDSVGIGCLVGHWISLKKQGGRLALLNPSVRLQNVLRVVGLHEVIESVDDIGKINPQGVSNPKDS